MIIRRCYFDEFGNVISDRSVILFGGSEMPREMDMLFSELEIGKRVKFVVDNDSNKQGTTYHLRDADLQVVGIEDMIAALDVSKDILVITSRYYGEICSQLNAIMELDKVECIVYPLLESRYENTFISRERERCIDKVIHYCWFGKSHKSDAVNRCIESWHKNAPDFDIKEWTEDNWMVTGRNQYVTEAYKKKKWAFVSDYAALDIVYRCGGIYFDTDVELFRPVDEMLFQRGFAGFEMSGMVNLGSGFGAVKGLDIIREMRDYYDGISFIRDDGTLNEDACTVHQTKVLKEHGLLINNKKQTIDGLTIYPTDFFCPYDLRYDELNITERTFSIHHFEGTWWSEDNRRIHIAAQDSASGMRRLYDIKTSGAK